MLVCGIIILVATTTMAKANEVVVKNDLSEEAIAFLLEHDVDLAIFDSLDNADIYTLNSNEDTYVKSVNSEVLAIAQQAKAYNFTDEQIQALIGTIVTHKPTVINTNEETYASTRCNDPSSTDRINDDGVGYEVRSLPGYYQTTAYATLPTVDRGSGDNTAAYMFFTINGKVDIGLGYDSGWYGNRWRYFHKYENGEIIYPSAEEDLVRLNTIKDIYMYAYIDGDEAIFKVVNANNFNEVICEVPTSISNLGITEQNADWNRQISLCKQREDDGSVILNGGAKLENAEFSQAHIYKKYPAYTEHFLTTSSNCVDDRTGVFGLSAIQNSETYVQVHSHKDWYEEKVSIYFPE